MPQRTLPGLGLEAFFDLGENGWNDEFDENMRKLSFMVDGRVKSRATSLPGTGTAGDVYVVPSGDANGNQIAIWDGPSGSEAWVYYPAKEGWAFYVLDEDINIQFDGSAWNEFAAAGDGGGGTPGGGDTELTYHGARGSFSSWSSATTAAWVAVPLDAEQIDTDGFLDVAGANPERFTIPAGVSRVRIMANVWKRTDGATSTSDQWKLYKNDSIMSASEGGLNIESMDNGYGNSGQSGLSAVLDVVEGDYFDLRVFQAVANANFDGWLEIEVLEGTVLGSFGGSGSGSGTPQALAKLSTATNQAIPATTITQIEFETADTDVGDFWDAGSPSQFTVPAGVETVLVSVAWQVDSSPGVAEYELFVRKNGSSVFYQRTSNNSWGGQSVAQIINVAEGDVINAVLWSTDAVTLRAGRCHFGILDLTNIGSGGGSGSGVINLADLADVDDTGAVEGDVLTRQADGSYALETPVAGSGGGSSENWAVPWRGATVTMSAQDLDLSSGTILSWDSQVNDTDNFWDGAAPTVFSIPAGVTKVRLKARIDLGSGALNSATPYMEFRKNGSTFFVGNGTVAHGQGYNNQMTSLISGVIDVVEGDTLDVNAQFSDSVVPVLNPGTYFQIEVVEATDRSALSRTHSFFIPGLPDAGATVYKTVFTETTILKTTTPTELHADVAATGVSVFTIARNGVSVGTITVAASGTVGSVTVGSDVTFNAGDRMTVIAPGSQDATLADIAITVHLQMTS